MALERTLYQHLMIWKESDNRKPLILRGARQVGKTTLVREFSTSYKHRIFLNLELPRDQAYFKKHDNVQNIVESLFISNNIPSKDKHEVLLFIDEIQECPEVISLLRYFYEFETAIHVIAAGSLLEHVLNKVKSFPVGRVQMLHLYPMNFQEYLKAMDQDRALQELKNIPIQQLAHAPLLDAFKMYAIIGGMPEVVNHYKLNGSISDLVMIYESIWETYKEDIEKYASNSTDARVIKHIVSTAHLYVDKRIKFQNFANSNYRSREVGEAFRKLDDARVIQLIYPSTDTEAPIQEDLKKSPRLQFLDTGIINNELNIQAEMLAMDDLSTAYKGAIIPHLITQELMSISTSKMKKPVFWVREKKQSSAEVDLLMQYRQYTIPIEIKSGKEGKLKSLHQFIDACPHPYAIRMYSGNFQIEQHQTSQGKDYYLMNMPYYLGTVLTEYLEYFVSEQWK